MTILYSEHNSPSYIRPPILAPDQVICGPQYPNRADAGRVLSLKTAVGEYDISAVAARLPVEQRPTLLIVRGDNTSSNVPRNLGALSCRKVLAVGDTHHHPGPIRRLLRYALSEPFDAVIFDYTRQHAHFFVEAGLSSVYWLPAFNVSRINLPAHVRRDVAMTFIGNVGSRHPRRVKLFEALMRAGLPLQVIKAEASRARMIHARSRISLNCSLNGDLNLRVFEVLASRGMLLTDRLGPQAGLDLLLAEGQHTVMYDSAEDCVAHSRTLLKDPALADRIAEAGHAHYEMTLAPERIREDFFAIVDSGKARREFEVGHDPRSGLERSGDRRRLMRRIAQYELMQELHRQLERLRVAAMPGVDTRLLGDILDLPRLSLAVDVGAEPEREGAARDQLARIGMAGRCEFLGGEAGLTSRPWDVLLATIADWRAGRARAAMNRGSASLLLVTDLADDPAARNEIVAAGLVQAQTGIALFHR